MTVLVGVVTPDGWTGGLHSGDHPYWRLLQQVVASGPEKVGNFRRELQIKAANESPAALCCGRFFFPARLGRTPRPLPHRVRSSRSGSTRVGSFPAPPKPGVTDGRGPSPATRGFLGSPTGFPLCGRSVASRQRKI